MRTFLKLLWYLVLLSPVMLAAAAWFALSERPLVESNARLTHQDIARAQAMMQAHDPRGLPDGLRRDLEIAAGDVSLIADYLIQRAGQGAARVAITGEVMDIAATLRLPRLPARQYVNLEAALVSRGGRPAIDSVRIGALPVPVPIAEWLLAGAYRQLYRSDAYRLADSALQDFALLPGRLRVSYAWSRDLIDRARDVALHATDKVALRSYLERLVALQSGGVGKSGSLVGLLGPLFATAAERSAGGDAVAENQALLSVLGAWASGRGLDQLVPGMQRRPARFRLSLERRRDFGQHFLTSAALASRGDGALSDAVGLFKEMQDAESGSGFSFTDIAADRAGTRFGQMAVASQASARALQNTMAAGVQETDIMPKARDLPEHMTAAQFKQRFGHVGSPAYEGVMAEIESRIARCALYAGKP